MKAALHKLPGKSSLNVSFSEQPTVACQQRFKGFAFPVCPGHDHQDHHDHHDHDDHGDHDNMDNHDDQGDHGNHEEVGGCTQAILRLHVEIGIVQNVNYSLSP